MPGRSLHPQRVRLARNRNWGAWADRGGQVDRNSKRAVSGEQGEARWVAGASMGWIVGNCQPNGAFVSMVGEEVYGFARACAIGSEGASLVGVE